MQNWIVETLTLVRRHAAENGLENLTEEMDIALLVAAEEFARRDDAAGSLRNDGGQAPGAVISTIRVRIAFTSTLSHSASP